MRFFVLTDSYQLIYPTRPYFYASYAENVAFIVSNALRIDEFFNSAGYGACAC